MSPANLLIAGIYYLLAGLITFFSAFGVYILLRYGENRLFSLVLGLVYSVLFLAVLQNSFQALTTITNK